MPKKLARFSRNNNKEDILLAAIDPHKWIRGEQVLQQLYASATQKYLTENITPEEYESEGRGVTSTKSMLECNEEWMPALAPLLNKGNAFVAVGALHLGTIGKGLVSLLRERGYTPTKQ